MFSYAAADEPRDEHQRLLAWEREFIDKLELAYRVIDVAAGDLGIERGAQVRHRGVVPVAGHLPRADVDVELHDVPGPPAQHPHPHRRAATSRSPRSTARCARSPARSPACSTTTSSPTARSTCPRRCARGSAAASSSNRRDDQLARERPRRHVGAIGRDGERPHPGRAAPGRRGRAARRVRHRAAAALAGRDRRRGRPSRRRGRPRTARSSTTCAPSRSSGSTRSAPSCSRRSPRRCARRFRQCASGSSTASTSATSRATCTTGRSTRATTGTATRCRRRAWRPGRDHHRSRR